MVTSLLLSILCLIQIPLSLTEEGMPKITVDVEGKQLEAWVDLGRGIALIEESKLPAGSLSKTGMNVTSQAFNEQAKKQDEVKIGVVKIASYPFYDVKGTTGTGQIQSYSISPTNTSVHANAPPAIMLGNEIFRGGALLVDYKGGYFEYGKDSAEFIREIPFQRWAYVPFQIDRGQIQFLALTRGLSGHWILDSGSTINLIYKGFMGPLKFAQIDNQTVNFGRFAFILDNVYTSNKPLKTGIFGILGAPFLKKYRILIDFKKQHLYIEP